MNVSSSVSFSFFVFSRSMVCCNIIISGVRIYQQRFERSQLSGFCLNLNVQGRYSTVQIPGHAFADSAVLSRWVNRACVVLTAGANACKQVSRATVKRLQCVRISPPRLKPRTHTKKENLWVWSTWLFFFFFFFHFLYEKSTQSLHYWCWVLGFLFQNNLMACNLKKKKENVSIVICWKFDGLWFFFFSPPNN